MIQVENLCKRFETKGGTVEAAKNISFSIEKGEIFGIIGLSGAGKSTLVRCLNLLERPTSGTVKVNGKNLTELSEKELRKERQKIGMIFQHFNLLMQRTALDNVCFPMEIAGIGKAEARKKALEYLRIVGLEEKALSYPSQLSGGQKQRVAIARVLASDPQILLCDEATSALDPQTTKAILELIKEINRDYGITVVVITHEMSVVQEICDKVTIKTGIDFLESWHGIATGNIRTSGQEGESVLLKLSGKNFNDVCDSAVVIGKLFDGIFEKQSKCCCLLRINQLLHVAEIYILFSNQESIFSMYFYFELFRAAGVPSV